MILEFSVSPLRLSRSAVSIWSVVSARRTANLQAELQQRLEISREEDRVRQAKGAKLRAFIQKTGRDWRLFVMNEGEVTARNVKLELDGGPLLAHTLVPRGQEEVTKLGPGAHARYLLRLRWGSR